MIIKDLETCCDFICEWFGAEQSYPPRAPLLREGVPASVQYLHQRLGRLWDADGHPFLAVLNNPNQPLSLFVYQDTIVDPKDYQMNTGQIVPLVVENQGVWQFGFESGNDNAVFVTGDWFVNGESPLPGRWQKMDALVEDALIFALLGNLCLMSAGEGDWNFDHNPQRPSNSDRLLWNHQAWNDFDGFWTDADHEVVHYSLAWLTVRKKMIAKGV